MREIVIARPRLHLPWRVEQEVVRQAAFKVWQRTVYMTMLAIIGIAGLNALSLYLALHGAGKWSELPAMLVILPLGWLINRVLKGAEPVSEE